MINLQVYRALSGTLFTFIKFRYENNVFLGIYETLFPKSNTFSIHLKRSFKIKYFPFCL